MSIVLNIAAGGIGGKRTNSQSSEAYIVLSYGQSNEGDALTNEALGTHPYAFPLPTSPVDYNVPDSSILIAVDHIKPTGITYETHTLTYRWEPIEGDFWTGDSAVGYAWEQSYLRHLRDRVGDTVHFVRVEHGGVDIDAFRTGGSLYDLMEPSLTFAIDSILALGKTPVILFANWGQGESNQYDTNYHTKLSSVIDYVRGLYPPYTSNIPFMLRKLSIAQTYLSDITIINNEMDTVANNKTGVHAYSPDDMPIAPTGYAQPGGAMIHYDGPTQLRIGDYLFDLTVSNGIVP